MSFKLALPQYRSTPVTSQYTHRYGTMNNPDRTVLSVFCNHFVILVYNVLCFVSTYPSFHCTLITAYIQFYPSAGIRFHCTLIFIYLLTCFSNLVGAGMFHCTLIITYLLMAFYSSVFSQFHYTLIVTYLLTVEMQLYALAQFHYTLIFLYLLSFVVLL